MASDKVELNCIEALCHCRKGSLADHGSEAKNERVRFNPNFDLTFSKKVAAIRRKAERGRRKEHSDRVLCKICQLTDSTR